MIAAPFTRPRHLARRLLAAARTRIKGRTRPAPLAVVAGAAADATRSRAAPLPGNALLRHQLVALSRYALFVSALGSRRVVHVGVTRHPTDTWVAQQLREATSYGAHPRFLVRDNDAKDGPRFAQLAEASGIAVVRTPVRSPRANAVCERFLRSVRRECLDHLLPLGEAHLRRTLAEYVAFFNAARPHQGRGQRVPVPGEAPGSARHGAGEIVASRSSAGCTTPTSAQLESAARGRPRGLVARAATRPARSVRRRARSAARRPDPVRRV